MQRAALSAFVVGVLVVILAACTGGPPTPSPAASSDAVPSASPITQPSGPAPTSTPTSTASAPASEGVFPATMLGLPVMTVAAADTALAAGQLDGRFAAVGGYWRQYALPCAFAMHMPDIEGFCAGGKFADTAAGTDMNGGVGGDNTPVAMPETSNGDVLWSDASDAPVLVVLIVHADDSRSWQCAHDPNINCRQQMVIDDVAWVNGPSLSIVDSGPSAVSPKLSLDEVVSAGVKPGEQLITAYPLLATSLSDVDPRLMGKGSGIVWLVRVAQPVSGSDQTAAGTVRLISDADGSVVDELPLAVAADYNPARLVLDSQYSDNSADTDPHFQLLDGTTVLADDLLNIGTPPIAVDAGDYVLHAYLTGAPQPSGATCDQPITLAAGADAEYKTTFTGSTCKWAPFDPTKF